MTAPGETRTSPVDGIGSEARPKVVWRGDTAVAVDKPSGMLVHNSGYAGPRERSLRQELGEELGRRVFPVHRVDRGTSGLVLLALEQHHVAAWQAALSRPDAAKMYLALVRGHVAEPVFDLEYALRTEEEEVPTVQAARSLIVRVAASPVARCSLVAARIATGRRHQIRRHLAHLRHPVVNDARHGDSRFSRALRAELALLAAASAAELGRPEPLPFERMALHAWRLELESPQGPVRLEAAPSGAFAVAVEVLFPELGPAELASAADTLRAWTPDSPG